MDRHSYLPASWPIEGQASLNNVHAVTTLIKAGISSGDYAEYNLAAHVDDDPASVKRNRQKLCTDLQLPSEPVWLDQVHSNKVVDAANCEVLQADASFSRTKGVVCAVLTADCLPVFFCNLSGTEIAIAHAGWRGLHAGIITKTIQAMESSVDEILVSLGPAIGPQSFEVGTDVFKAFTDSSNTNESAFVATDNNHFLCDIYHLARIELQTLGITKIAGGEYCTYRDNQQFYSFRRQPRTGRMANLIWLS
ncbi:FIG00003370: Multicopper polyphenol oxidase [hydrothermal vent metagenome]|uniref:FIG00003370: Multicopper polyphenol oxidase n=1 Tax=hydrothermal vent metagenome TaxID=652676 RepID=A0A3B0WSH6_9ZZZZ